ncbi:ATP-dependent RNA helicase RhlB [Streptomyces beihaiensis]|uniref:ATP-dependent RNA helicase RhlB n=1 Tax=Streptomyces beihaiensis TaxID=2984495 RepID=UPI00389A9AD5
MSGRSLWSSKDAARTRSARRLACHAPRSGPGTHASSRSHGLAVRRPARGAKGSPRPPRIRPRTRTCSASVSVMVASALCAAASWKQPTKYDISVARKADVALMDIHVGPKH